MAEWDALEIAEFTKGYIEALIFTAPDEGHLHPGDMSATCEALAEAMPSSLRSEIEADCEQFIAKHAVIVTKHPEPERAGLDFAYTRNGHGTGYWDGSLGRLGQLLTEAAQGEGERNLIVEDWEDPSSWDYA